MDTQPSTDKTTKMAISNWVPSKYKRKKSIYTLCYSTRCLIALLKIVIKDHQSIRIVLNQIKELDTLAALHKLDLMLLVSHYKNK